MTVGIKNEEVRHVEKIDDGKFAVLARLGVFPDLKDLELYEARYMQENEVVLTMAFNRMSKTGERVVDGWWIRDIGDKSLIWGIRKKYYLGYGISNHEWIRIRD